ERVRRPGVLPDRAVHRQQAEPVERAAQRVDAAAEQFGPGARGGGAVAGRDLAADVQAGRVTERHEEHARLAETDLLVAHAEIGPRRTHEALIAEADSGAVRFDDEARDAGHRADALHRRQVANL